MTRRWKENPFETVETKFGRVEVTVTSATTTYLKADADGFTIRGARVSASEHFTLKDGRWMPSSEERGARRLVARRLDRGGGLDEATPAQTATALATLVEVARDFARDNPRTLAEAEVVSVSNQILRVEADVEKARKALDEAMAVRARLVARESDAIHVLEGMQADTTPRP